MKKAYILTSLIASVAFATTTGSVEFFNKNEHEIDKSKNTFKVKEIGVKTEVKVNGTGLSFGGTFKGSDLVIPLSKNTSKLSGQYEEYENYTIDTFFNNSNVYVKYDFEGKGVNSYIKATINPKVEKRNKGLTGKDKELSFRSSNVELEADINSNLSENVKVGVNSKTKLPFKKKVFFETYGDNVISTHKLYLDAKKVSVLKNVKANVELQHSYGLNEALKYVALSLDGTYEVMPKLDLTSKFKFKYQFNGESKVKNLLTGEDIKLNFKDYAHSYELDAKYLMLDDKLELTGGAFIQHAFDSHKNVSLETLLNMYKDSNDYKELEKLEKELSALKDEKDKAYKELTKEGSEYAKAKKEFEEVDKKLKDAKAGLDNDAEIKPLKKEYDELEKEVSKLNDQKKKLVKIKDELEGKKDELKEKNEYLAKRKEKLVQELKDKLNKELLESNDDFKTKFDKYKTKLDEEINKIKEDIQKNITAKEKEELTKLLAIYEENIAKIDEEIKKLDEKLKDKKEKKEAKHEELEDKYEKKYDKSKGNSNGDYLKLNSEKVTKATKLSTEEEKLTKGGSANDNEKAIKAYYDKQKEVKNKKVQIETYENDSIKQYENDVTSSQHQINYGVKLGAKYTGIENLTLKANGVFGATTYMGIENYTKCYVKLELGAKYDYKITDKFTVSPELNVTSKFSDIQKNKFKSELVLAPKVSAKYILSKNLNIGGEVEVPFKLDGDNTKFGFKNANIKTSLNIKYMW